MPLYKQNMLFLKKQDNNASLWLFLADFLSSVKLGVGLVDKAFCFSKFMV